MQQLTQIVSKYEDTLIAFATGGGSEVEDYNKSREEFLEAINYRHLIPKYILDCRREDQFWAFISNEFGTYKERRKFISDSFNPLFSFLENSTKSLDKEVFLEVEKLGESYISTEWNKALERKNTDPEAAITSARSLIETVCKFILDETNTTYKDSADLPKLYGEVCKVLNLSPQNHSEDTFKQILSGCISVTVGLGALRNKFGDAHGKTKKTLKPSARHAALAVNLSGSMCVFLLETLKNQK